MDCGIIGVQGKVAIAQDLVSAVVKAGASRHVVAATASALFRLASGGESSSEADDIGQFAETLDVAKLHLGEHTGVSDICGAKAMAN